MKEKSLHKNEKLQEGSKSYSLILFNDDFNTFGHVINLLIDICGHDPVQAEQCALIVHYHGSYEVKRGSEEVLTVMNRALIEGGLRSLIKIQQ